MQEGPESKVREAMLAVKVAEQLLDNLDLRRVLPLARLAADPHIAQACPGPLLAAQACPVPSSFALQPGGPLNASPAHPCKLANPPPAKAHPAYSESMHQHSNIV